MNMNSSRTTKMTLSTLYRRISKLFKNITFRIENSYPKKNWIKIN
jgi:hypothetical protein